MARRAAAAVFLFFAATWGTALRASGIYRWTDPGGQTHYSDRPHAGAQRLHLGTDHESWGRVERVLDGDTIELAGGTRVRLIGINAPEIAHLGDPAQPGGRAAHRYLRELLEGARVRIEPGRQRRDRYHRLLAHVFTESGQNVAAELLRRGYVHAVVYPPNLRHARAYFAAEKAARDARLGLWRQSVFTVQPVARAAALRNRYCRLRGRITAVEKKRKYTYLKFGAALTAAIANTRLALFDESGKAPADLKGRTVVMRGWVRQKEGSAFLRLRHPLQIEL
jgi:micrococcal nuclease